MKKVSEKELAASKEYLKSVFYSLVFDSWIIMLALGGLSHQLNIPKLAIGYWSCMLIVVIGQAILPQTFGTNAYLRQVLKSVDLGDK